MKWFFPVYICLLVVLASMMMFGCATHPVPAPAAHPAANVESNISSLQHGLTTLNYLGILGAAIGVGLAVYALVTGDTALERIGFIVAAITGSLVAITLTGIIVLPFAPWLLLGIGGLGLAGAGYEIYVKFFAKKAAAPALTLPKP